MTWAGSSGSPAAGGAGAAGRSSAATAPLRCGRLAASVGADRRGRAEQREVAGAPQHVVRVVADHGHARRRLDHEPWVVHVQPEGGRADGEHEVVAGEQRAQLAAPPRQVARRTGGDPAGSRGGSRTRPARRGIRGARPAQRPPPSPPSCPRPRPTTSAGRRRGGEQRGELRHRRAIDRRCGEQARGAAGPAHSSPSGSSQSPMGTTTSAGPRRTVASCQARAMAPGTSEGCAGCVDQTG